MPARRMRYGEYTYASSDITLLVDFPEEKCLSINEIVHKHPNINVNNAVHRLVRGGFIVKRSAKLYEITQKGESTITSLIRRHHYG